MCCMLDSMTQGMRKHLLVAKTRTTSYVRNLDVQHGQARREISPKGTIIPIAIASIVFCMWGLAYGLLDIMNYHIKVAMGIEREMAAILALGYYAAYIPGALFIGGPLVQRCGYRLAIIVGLMLLAFGDLLMSVGATHRSFGGMVASHFIVGLGVSTLERAANPYAVNCGPRTQAALRILIAQAWAGVGTVLAPPIANGFVFNAHGSTKKPSPDPEHSNRCLMPPAGDVGSLTSVVTFYRALGGLVFGLALILAVLFFRTTWFPEVTQPVSPKVKCGWRFWKHPVVSLKYSRMWWGVFSNFFNLGCQVGFAQFFFEHMRVSACQSDKGAANMMAIAQSAFVIGRFAAAALVSMRISITKPRLVLLVFVAAAIAFTGAGTAVTGLVAIVCAVLVMGAEAPTFPMIFEAATAGFGEWAPLCETLMITSISGGGLQPLALGFVVSRFNIWNGWIMTTSGFGLVLTFALANNLIPSFRKALDKEELGQIEGRGSQDSSLVGKDEETARVSEVSFVQPAPQHTILAGYQASRKGYFGGTSTPIVTQTSSTSFR